MGGKNRPGHDSDAPARPLQGHYTPGTYTVTWRGEGTVTVSMDDVKCEGGGRWMMEG